MPFRLDGTGVSIDPQIRARVADRLQTNDNARSRARVAAALQRQFNDLLLEFLREVRHRHPASNLCLAGGLFYNTNVNTRIRESGVYDDVFIPIHPGNAGLAVGCALSTAGDTSGPARDDVDPFLGPQYSDLEIKSVLDNCKLSYDFVNQRELMAETVAALRRGHLVGWFQGRMEWGPRALGSRSILASPLAPYVLENLNTFLKRREPPRSYGVSVCEEDLDDWFDGPNPSPVMQFEHRLKDPRRLSNILPHPGTPIRVHTVSDRLVLLQLLLKEFGTATGTPVLVNTSFNGFREPIVCTPRDAVRVFYGSGLDLLVIGNFILRK
jgi:carbamoyltransferase